MISVVIPLYNRKECILRLIKDILEQKNANKFEIIIVDDCSPDDSVETIRKEFPEVKLLVNERNGGPCVSRNRGINAASGEIIVGFDSDVSLADPYLLSKIKKSFDELPKLSGFAFRIYESDGKTDDAPRWWHPISIEVGKACEFETDYFSGTAYAFRKETIVKAGLFPEILYMDYEEVELAWRILDNGGTIHYQPNLSVVHHANSVSRRSEIKVFYKPRNQLLITIRCFTFWNGLFYIVPRLGRRFVLSIFGGYNRRWWQAIKSAIKLAKECQNNVTPLKKSTFKRISSLKKQSLDS